jgi:hypothetical protein
MKTIPCLSLAALVGLATMVPLVAHSASRDAGTTWETNWTMQFTRTAES